MRRIALLMLGVACFGIPFGALAQDIDPTIEPLTNNFRPPVPRTADIVTNEKALIQLGKALFWDIQVGSDGVACAGCHFQAGADIRIVNQVNPGPDGTFALFPSGNPTGPNATLDAADFPLWRLADPDDRNSELLFAIDDVISSAGTFAGEFLGTTSVRQRRRLKVGESCDYIVDQNNPFHSVNRIHRKVEPRQTPPVVNAAFFERQFWDGRANNRFNGVDPFGPRTNAAVASAGIIVRAPGGGVLPSVQKIALANSSLASQAVGPALSDFEMSCAGRKWADIGRKLLGTRALAKQAVHRNDSVFGTSWGLLNWDGRGLSRTYRQMIQQAFSPKYWTVDRRLAVSDTGAVTIAQTGGYTQIEHNFSLFFGLAVQAYERTLISDRTRFDRDRLTDAEARGRDVFTGKGQCVACHSGPLFSNATVFDGHEHEDVERMVMGDGGVALYDTGFYNIGVTPTDADRGVGGSDPFGNPLSFSRQFISRLQNQPVPDSFNVDPCGFDVPFGDPCDVLPSPAAAAQERVAVEGAFKTPSLRNIALTPPYMHNGSLATLEQVVDFYDRGGNARSVADTCDTTGFKQANTDAERCSNLDADIKVLDLSDGEKADLVAFLKALTDERVACHAAPFDHPALPLPVGHGAGAATTIQSGYASSTAIVGKSSGRTRAVALTKSARGGGISRITAVSDLAIDQVAVLPATGAGGYSASPTNKPCFPSTGDLFGETQAVLNRILR